MKKGKQKIWRVLRARLGKKHAIRAKDIAAHTGMKTESVRAAIKSLRDDDRLRIGYSRTRPTGYFIIQSGAEAEECTQIQRRAAVAMLIRECTLRGVSLPALLSEIQREHAPNTPPPTAYPATPKQKIYLSRLLLSSIHSEGDADNLFQLIASPDFSKQHAARLIDQIQKSIDQRNADRADSKMRRIVYLEIHHPDTSPKVLPKRDRSLTDRNWNQALEEERPLKAGRDIFDD